MTTHKVRLGKCRKHTSFNVTLKFPSSSRGRMERDHYHGRKLEITLTCLSEQESVHVDGREGYRAPLESYVS